MLVAVLDEFSASSVVDADFEDFFYPNGESNENGNGNYVHRN